MGSRCTDDLWKMIEQARNVGSFTEQAQKFYQTRVAVRLIEQEADLRHFYHLCGLPRKDKFGYVFSMLSEDV